METLRSFEKITKELESDFIAAVYKDNIEEARSIADQLFEMWEKELVSIELNVRRGYLYFRAGLREYAQENWEAAWFEAWQRKNLDLYYEAMAKYGYQDK